MVLEQVPDHQHSLAVARGGERPFRICDRLRERLLDEAVFPGLEHPYRQLGVARDRCGERNRVELIVAEHLVEVVCEPHARELPRDP